MGDLPEGLRPLLLDGLRPGATRSAARWAGLREGERRRLVPCDVPGSDTLEVEARPTWVARLRRCTGDGCGRAAAPPLPTAAALTVSSSRVLECDLG